MKTQFRFFAVISMFFLIIGSANSQVLELNSLSTERGYEPVEIKMEASYFDRLFQQSVPTNRLFLYAYHSGTGWAPIPFQIDENDAFKPSNNQTDDSDILIFLAKDLGDRVTLGNWIDNLDSKSYKRYEIEIVDPTNRDKKGWCYLFVSATLAEQDKSPVKYIAYDTNTDIVKGKSYQLDYNKKWYPENIRINSEAGGNNQDFYDRTKLRFILQLSTFPYTIIEDSLLIHPDKPIVSTPNSTIRFKRQLYIEMRPFNPPPPKFTLTFYPYSTLFSGEIGLDQYVGLVTVKMIRMSYDLNSMTAGMKFWSGDEQKLRNQNISINGFGSLDNADTSVVKKKKNWTMATGAPGTMLTINNVRYESNPPTVTPEPYEQYLYYWDNLSGSTLPPRIMDTQYDWDTGDSSSYGDHGMVFESFALTDSFHYNSTTFYLKKDLPADTAQAIFDNLNNLLLRYIRAQDFLTSVENINENGLPTEYRLRPNFPNPFNPSTQISFELPVSDNVKLQVFDVQGRLINTLVDRKLDAGVYTFSWNGRDNDNQSITSGIYICTFQANGFTASQKMVYVK